MIKNVLLAASVGAGLLATAGDATAAEPLFSSLALAKGNSGNLQVVGIGAANGLPYLVSWQDSTDGSWHAGFALPSAGGRLSSLALAQGNSGNLQVVGIGAANGLPFLASWQGSTDGSWHAGFALPSSGMRLSSLALAQGNSGNLQVVGIGDADGLPYLASWQGSGNGTWYAGFALPSAGVRLSSLALAQGNSGNLQVVGIGAADGLPYLASWQGSGNGTWYAGFALPSAGVRLSSLALAQGNSGNLQVVGIGAADGLPYLASWQGSGNGTWYAGFALPSAGVRLSSLALAQGNNGNLQVVGIGAADGLPYLASWQDSTDGSWHAGFALPSAGVGLSSIAVAQGNVRMVRVYDPHSGETYLVPAAKTGNLQVVGSGAADGLPYLASWQDSTDGSWHAGFKLPTTSCSLNINTSGWQSKGLDTNRSSNDPSMNPPCGICGGTRLPSGTAAGACSSNTYNCWACDDACRDHLNMNWTDLNWVVNVTRCTTSNDLMNGGTDAQTRGARYIYVLRTDNMLLLRRYDRSVPGNYYDNFQYSGNRNLGVSGDAEGDTNTYAHVRHSQLNGGWNPVWCAGEMLVCGGKIAVINNASGHFQPSSACLNYVTQTLQATNPDLVWSNVTVGDQKSTSTAGPCPHSEL
ncbi:hypothetical protein AB3662_44890 [Sorangium cellulosum]|uniref:hypothetical protein n=1 Tax=Sorangium cellulosum TaxID=56 RepID=UPI003D9A80BC